MKNKEYSIGLDIGVTSVGYSVIDKNHKVLRFKNKNMMGVRLFKEGLTAQKRREFRSNRRRLARRRNRINYLRELIGSEVLKKDKQFFYKLDNSFTLKKQNACLFNDKSFTDKDYYKEYPTMYHLRSYLYNETKQVDIRLIYLALAHLIKYRGHFLIEGNLEKPSGAITDSLVELQNILTDFLSEEQFNFDTLKATKILDNTALTLKQKEYKLKEIFNSNNKQTKTKINHMIKAILGYKFSIKEVFSVEGIDSIQFSKENENDFETLLGDNYNLFNQLQIIYSNIKLSAILNNHEIISQALVEQYHKHGEDIRKLKLLCRKHFSDQIYHDLFRNNNKGYKKYINNATEANYEKMIEDINKHIKEIDCSEKDYIAQRIEQDKLLKKIRTRDNAAIPNQLHKIELKQILENQAKYYPCLAKNQDKILSIFSFKIPYYVGPLVKDSPFAWLERTNQKIYPWNFNEVVDKDKTAEKFIERMKNTCTYLYGEPVLPKKSLLYSEFMVLNELNKIMIGDKKISLDLKKEIYNKVFKTRKVIKKSDLEKWLVKNTNIHYEIKGMQKEDRFATSLTSYIDFVKIVGKKFIEDNNKCIEDIIYYLTIYNDKEIIKRRIVADYQDKLTEEQVRRILKLNYSGWARLSSKLLNGIKGNNEETIIEVMRNGLKNENFMQILNNKKYGFGEKLNAINKSKKSNKLSYKIVKKLPTSPANKRGIWQAVKIVKELVSIMGCEPKNIFIEMAREDGEKKRTTSRLKKIKKMYENIKSDIADELKKITKEADMTERVYLYFLQQGKCMYSQKPLNINNLSSYDIDHIIPQSYIKDDSLTNKVLVYKEQNMRKNDGTISQKVRSKMQPFWHMLWNKGMISNKKYYSLTKKSYDTADFARFINRQLVETRQISKHVVNLFSNYFTGTKIVPIKAGLISNVRKTYDFYKIRELNDFHHAHDAFLAAIIGSYLIKKYKNWGDISFFKRQNKLLKNYLEYYQKNKNARISYLLRDIESTIVNKDTGEVIWQGNNALQYINKVLNYKNLNFSRMLEENTGEFYDQTIYKKGTKKANIKLKKHLAITEFGGYNSQKNAYSCIIEYTKNNKRVKTMVAIPVEIASLQKNNNAINNYLVEHYQDVKVIKPKILNYQEFEQDGCRFFVVSANEICNAKQLILSAKNQQVLYAIVNKHIQKSKIQTLITHDNLNSLFNEFLVKYETHYLFSRTKSVLNKLQNYEAKFCDLSVAEKIDFLLKVLAITRANSLYANLKDYKLSSGLGRLNEFKYKISNITFINKSVTGLYEEQVSYEL